MLCRNTDAGVTHFQACLAFQHCRTYCDMTTNSVVLEGIVEQHQHHLLQPYGVSDHERRTTVLDLDINMHLVGERLDAVYDREGHRGQVDDLAFLMHPPGIQASEF